MDEIYNKHYIDVDDQGRIVNGWSDGPHPQRAPTDQTHLLTDKGGYQFRLPVLFTKLSGEHYHLMSEENPALWDIDGIFLYKWIDGQVVPRTEEEMAADRVAIPALPISDQERFEAQLFYTAMKTDTLIGE